MSVHFVPSATTRNIHDHRSLELSRKNSFSLIKNSFPHFLNKFLKTLTAPSEAGPLKIPISLTYWGVF